MRRDNFDSDTFEQTALGAPVFLERLTNPHSSWGKDNDKEHGQEKQNHWDRQLGWQGCCLFLSRHNPQLPVLIRHRP
jgi:hypothetical protein